MKTDLRSCCAFIASRGTAGRIENDGMSFEDFKTAELMDDVVVRCYTDLLTACDHEFDITGKDLLMTYLFAYYDFATTGGDGKESGDGDSDNSNDDLGDLGDRLKVVSLDILRRLHACAPTDIDRVFRDALTERLVEYQTLYVPWKARDKLQVLRQMTQNYWEYELIYRLNDGHFTPEERDAFVRKKNERQRFLLKRMETMDNLEYFYGYVPVVMDDTVVKNIHATLKRAYWDDLKQNMRQDFDKLVGVLRELKANISALIPVSKSILRQHFDEGLDLEFIGQLHANGAIDTGFWTRKCEFLASVLKDIDSPAHDEDHDSLLQTLMDNVRGTNDDGEKFEACVDYLAIVMERVSEIAAFKDAFR